MAFVFYRELRITDSSGLPGVDFVRGDSVPFGSLHRVAAGWGAGRGGGIEINQSPGIFARAKADSTTL